jgi:hypothetical protein
VLCSHLVYLPLNRFRGCLTTAFSRTVFGVGWQALLCAGHGQYAIRMRSGGDRTSPKGEVLSRSNHSANDSICLFLPSLKQVPEKLA